MYRTPLSIFTKIEIMARVIFHTSCTLSQPRRACSLLTSHPTNLQLFTNTNSPRLTMSSPPSPRLLNPRAHVLSGAASPLSPVPPSSSATASAPTSSLRFSPEEESQLLSTSLSHKQTGNSHFSSQPPDYH